MKKCIVILALLSFGQMALSEETEASILKKASVSWTVDTAPDSLLVESKGILAPGVALRSVLVWQKKHKQCALMVYDASDDTPILVCKGGRAFIYDVDSMQLLFVDNVGVRFTFAAKNQELKWENGFKMIRRGAKTVVYDDFVIDFGSVLAGAPNSIVVTKQQGSIYSISALTNEGGKVTAVVDSKADIAIKQLDITPKGSKEPLLLLSRIETGLSLQKSFFSLPRQRLDKLPLANRTVKEQKISSLPLHIGRACFLRGAMRDPVIQNKLPDIFQRERDWMKLKKQDKEISKLLRGIFPAFKAKSDGR